ncbi:hypothetical protein C8A06_0586 [Microbacteriaceae bacterium MWH-Ta3]|nr:hypothetical protein C8A06_0586 [Microbacteriaceae bacterium MWH-Ta3]
MSLNHKLAVARATRAFPGWQAILGGGAAAVLALWILGFAAALAVGYMPAEMMNPVNVAGFMITSFTRMAERAPVVLVVSVLIVVFSLWGTGRRVRVVLWALWIVGGVSVALHLAVVAAPQRLAISDALALLAVTGFIVIVDRVITHRLKDHTGP